MSLRTRGSSSTTRIVSRPPSILDVAVGLLDEAIDHAESETGPLADILGGKERLENTLQNRGGNAVPGIGHLHPDVISSGDFAGDANVTVVKNDIAGRDGQLATVRHRVAGVEREIEDGVVELTGIDQRQRDVAGEFRHDLD